MSKYTKPMKLIDFVEQFVAHNTVVEIYSLELVPEKITDTITRYCKKFDKLETVMEWQITEPDDCAYYKAHPDVKPSKYRYHNVEMIVGVPNHIDRTDLVGIVVSVDDKKVKRIFNEAGLTVEKREQPLTSEELDKQVKEIMSCFEEVQNGEDKG